MADKNYTYTIGRRKETTAVVKLFAKGTGRFMVKSANGSERTIAEYFGGNIYLLENALLPLKTLGGDYMKNFDLEIIINGGGIAVLDSSLHKIADIQASELADAPQIKESLVLAFDHYTANSGATVVLSGAGYLPGEALSINFGGTITKLQADSNGRFSQSLVVPSSLITKTVDAKVDGLDSKETYSTSFNIVK